MQDVAGNHSVSSASEHPNPVRVRRVKRTWTFESGPPFYWYVDKERAGRTGKHETSPESGDSDARKRDSDYSERASVADGTTPDLQEGGDGSTNVNVFTRITRRYGAPKIAGRTTAKRKR